MNKKKGFILVICLLVTSVLTFLLINEIKISNENSSLKNGKGAIIQANVRYISLAVYDSKKDLSSNSISDMNRDYWKFNEFTMFDMPQGVITSYLLNIRNDFSELIRLNETNSSQQEINQRKTILEKELSRLGTSLSIIKEDCETDNNKYFLLNSEGNITMQNVLKILLE
ncbi:hypothetical protein [Clostridium sp.]|uniref:hypothetical protein n=1 Tax=Clostridium sp. TaxID=1506 RepID=UPI003D6C9BE9